VKQPSARTTRRLVGVAAALGLGLRVAWSVWVARTPIGLHDPARYLGYAEEIRVGHGMTEPFSGFPTAYYPPGYPWFLGIVAWLTHPFTDRLPLVIALIQSVLGTISVVLGAGIARRLAGRRAAIIAAFGLAVYPNLVMHAGAILGETLYNTLFLAFLMVIPARLVPGRSQTRQVAAAGIVLGLAVMVRPVSLAIVPLVPLVWWLVGRRAERSGVEAAEGDATPREVASSKRPLAWSSVVLVVAVVACIAPWTIRNEVRMHQFVPISTNTGDNLCIGHAQGATGAFAFNHRCDVPYPLLEGPASEVKGDRARTRIALHEIAAHPGNEPKLLWKRIYYTWISSGDHDALSGVQGYGEDLWMARSTDRGLGAVADGAYVVVMLAGFTGLVVLCIRRPRGALMLVGSALATAAVPLLFFGDSRFKVPVIPLLIVAGATLFAGRRAHPPDAAEPWHATEAGQHHSEPAAT
jgi:hypothetical protein